MLTLKEREQLSARNLRKYNLRFAAYNGANKRRFVLFELVGTNELRREFDTKAARAEMALRRLEELRRLRA